MKKDFERKIIYNGIYDTKKYRYVLRMKDGYNEDGDFEQWAEIVRLPIAYIDTTAAIDGWETVKVIKE